VEEATEGIREGPTFENLIEGHVLFFTHYLHKLYVFQCDLTENLADSIRVHSKVCGLYRVTVKLLQE